MDRGAVGVKARGNSIQLSFTYKGQQIRETLRTKPTKTALKEATRMRESLLRAIAFGRFEYSEYFPDSRNAIKFAREPGQLITVKEALKSWLLRSQKRTALSTLKRNSNIVYNQLIPAFGHLYLTDFTVNHLHDWVLTKNLTNKTLNNIISPLLQVFRDAYYDNTLEVNPLERWRLLPITQREPEPFTQSEIAKILSCTCGQGLNLLQFAFWSGLRTSELIALRWKDIDYDNNRFYVRVAMVERQEKTTKTSSGLRTVEFNEHSLSAIKNQEAYTKDNERIFNDPAHNKPWVSDQGIRRKLWTPALERAGVKYRNPYQTRHTFASTMLSQGKNPLWVAQQMGHKDWSMIIKTYGRWIPQD